MKALQNKYVKHKHNSRLTELQSQQRDLEAKLKHDYSLEGVFEVLETKFI